jgi:hypothetical protein
MTLDEIAAIEARAEAATKGPWHKGIYGPRRTDGCSQGLCVSHDIGAAICYFDRPGAPDKDEADQDFITNSREDIPNLCAALRTAMEERDAAVEALAPFAIAADRADVDNEAQKTLLRNSGMTDNASPGWGVKYGHLKAARDVLQRVKPVAGEEAK